MHGTEQRFPIRVQMGWVDYSPALHAYASTTLARSLGAFANDIRAVTVRITDHEAHAPATRLCAIEVELKPTGTMAATATGRDVHALVGRATDAVLARLRATHRPAREAESLPRIA